MIASVLQFLMFIGKMRIIPIADSYLLLNTFKKQPKMSREIIRTNYLSLSPYQATEITSFTQEKNLLVWFQPLYENTIKIPEALLLYQALAGRSNHDRIAIFNTSPITLIVIKNNHLIAQSTLISDSEIVIERLKREHAIATIERYSLQEHQILLKSGYTHLSFQNLQQLFSLEFPDTTSLKSTLQNVATPMSIIMLAALGLHYAQNYYLTQRLQESTQAYQEGRGTMIPIKHRLDMIGEHKKIWDLFLSDTLIRPDATHGALGILKAARETNTTVKYVKVSGGKVESVIETPNTTKFLKAILKTHLYENVKLEFSKTDPLRQIDNAKVIAQIVPYDLNGSAQ